MKNKTDFLITNYFFVSVALILGLFQTVAITNCYSQISNETILEFKHSIIKDNYWLNSKEITIMNSLLF